MDNLSDLSHTNPPDATSIPIASTFSSEIDLAPDLTNVRLVRVFPQEWQTLKEYVVALYQYDEKFDSLIHVEDGVKSLFRYPQLVSPYFIKNGMERLGYVILTRYHSIEKGGLIFFIDELYIEHPFRRNGIGRIAMKQIFEMAREEGIRALSVQVEPLNEGSKIFFEQHGFRLEQNRNFFLPL